MLLAKGVDQMRIIQFTKRQLRLALLVFTAALGLTLVACTHHGSVDSASVLASTDAQRAAYLNRFGWQVESAPLETLDLQLPEKLEGEWKDYAALQSKQDLPFAAFAGHTVRRYTYTVTNYPEEVRGAQANLYLCGKQIIGGDIMVLGEGGFTAGLAYPES